MHKHDMVAYAVDMGGCLRRTCLGALRALRGVATTRARPWAAQACLTQISNNFSMQRKLHA
eukprot:4078658-Pleurochrysis_carterae.AAC.1